MFRRTLQSGHALWKKVRAHPRKSLLILLLALAALVGGAYLLRPRLSGLHHWRQAEKATEEGDYAVAIAQLNERRKIWPEDAATYLFLARTYRRAGNLADAQKSLQAAERFRGDRESIALESLLLDAEAGDFQRVESTLREHIEKGHPERSLLLEGLIRGYLARQRSDDAQHWASLWIAEAPHDWQPCFLRAIARTQLSRNLLSTPFEQAIRDYERVLELCPEHASARFLLANAYTMTGQFQEALPHLRAYCARKPDDAVGAAALAGCLRSLGRIEEARAALDDWLKAHSATENTTVLRGQIALDLGEPEEALKWLRTAETMARSPEKTHYQLAIVLRACGRDDEAAEYEKKWRTHRELTKRLQELQQLTAKEPKDVGARHEAGVICLRLGQEDAGLRWLASALRLNPRHRLSHEALADHFRRRGNDAAAEHHRRLAESSQ